MKRSMMQMYVKDSAQAVTFYRRAFGAELGSEYRNPDGSYMHCELNAFGQILAISEAPEGTAAGSNMQFCFHFETDEREKLRLAYEVLKDGAQIVSPIGKCFYSDCMFALIDRFGVYWCLFE